MLSWEGRESWEEGWWLLSESVSCEVKRVREVVFLLITYPLFFFLITLLIFKVFTFVTLPIQTNQTHNKECCKNESSKPQEALSAMETQS